MKCLHNDLPGAPLGVLGGWTWGLHQQLQPRPWGNVALHSCLQGRARHTPFCCSNNRISAAGALSLGLGLRVNQTLRILAVSASLMGEAPAQTCLCLPTQRPPHHISAWCLRAHGGGGARLPPATSSSTHPSLAWPTNSFGLPPGPPGFPSPPPGLAGTEGPCRCSFSSGEDVANHREQKAVKGGQSRPSRTSLPAARAPRTAPAGLGTSSLPGPQAAQEPPAAPTSPA